MKDIARSGGKPQGRISSELLDALSQMGVRDGDALLLAFSGGADSLALLILMAGLAGKGKFRLTAAHLDHAVRGELSARDAEAAARICRRMGVPLLTGRLDPEEVRMLRRCGGSLEDALRRLRYRFLRGQALLSRSDWILTGHQREDQAETVLFRASRRMDWRSLSGIPGRRGNVLRPLLGTPRSLLEKICAAAGEAPLQDQTNEDLSIARNRIRRTLLPVLRKRFHPDLVSLLVRVSRASEQLARIERAMIERACPGIKSLSEAEIAVADIQATPPQLFEGAVHLILQGVCRRHPSRRSIRSFMGLLEKGGEWVLALPEGVSIRARGGRIMLPGTGCPQPLPLSERILEVPGQLFLGEAGLRIRALLTDIDGSGPLPQGDKVALDAAAVRPPLTVRARRPGDRFWPLGLQGPKKLKRFLIDRKVPQPCRDSLPMVSDASGRILWVAGEEIAHWARVGASGKKRVLILELERLHRPGANTGRMLQK